MFRKASLADVNLTSMSSSKLLRVHVGKHGAAVLGWEPLCFFMRKMNATSPNL